MTCTRGPIRGWRRRTRRTTPAIRRTWPRSNRIADHLAASEVLLPDGDRLTVDRFRFLGNAFGMGDGYERLHWLLDGAWHGSTSCRTCSGTR